MTNERMAELKEYLLQEIEDVELVTENEDFCVYDYSGSNVDDAFSLGLSEGKDIFVMELLQKFFDWNPNEKSN